MIGPDFVILGAMKCGTTTLAAQLGRQAGIFITDPKEPNFFSDDETYALGQDWYEDLFRGAAPGDIRGEASTHYTKRPDLPNTLPRMTKALAAPQLVYMVRNPLQRLVSHYIHEWSLNNLSGSLSAAIETYPDLVNYGRFGWQIEPYIEAYGREAILLTSLERLKSDPHTELARIAAHIGYDQQVHWQEELAVENASNERFRKLPLHNILVNNSIATMARRTLVPKVVRERIREAQTMKERPVIPQKHEATLISQFREDRDLLATFFPKDPSLELVYPFV